MPELTRSQEERRRHERKPASGPITLWWTECTRRKIEGRLLDLSQGGFRIAHTCAALGPGEQVQFEHAGGTGTARTVWTRIVADSVETGLLITGERIVITRPPVVATKRRPP